MDSEEWKLEDEGEVPSPADIIKYAHDKSRLLVRVPISDFPHETTIVEAASRGEYAKIRTGFAMNCYVWIRRPDLRIIAMLNPPGIKGEILPAGMIALMDECEDDEE